MVLVASSCCDPTDLLLLGVVLVKGHHPADSFLHSCPVLEEASLPKPHGNGEILLVVVVAGQGWWR